MINNKVKMRKFKKRTQIIAGFLIIIMLIVIIGVVYSTTLDIDIIDDLGEGDTSIRIAHLSDIHYPNCYNLSKLFKAVNNFEPHLVFITGDIIDKATTSEEIDELLIKLREITDIYPSYAVIGNHELLNANLIYFKEEIEKIGIELLENTSEAIVIEGKELIIAGVGNLDIYNEAVLDGAGDINQGSKILLLMHQPQMWEQVQRVNTEIMPLITFAGHAHGGQARLFGQGLVAPNQGLFPKYDSGIYYDELHQNCMILSRGLGHSFVPIRIYDSFHLPLVTVMV